MNENSNISIQYDNSELIISEQEKELNLFRSMYYQLNAKPDSMSKVFSHRVVIEREDILELNKQVNDKIKMHYHDDGYLATITVSLSNKQVLNFNCWEEFVDYQWNESQCVNSVILKWNFNIRMPQYEYPQNHTLMVKITNGLRPEELLNLIFSGNIEDFDEIETNTFPVAARVDFIEPILGEELLNIVSKWVKGLKHNRTRKNAFILFLKKYRKRVAQYFNYVSFVMISILGMVIINREILTFNVKYFKDLGISQFLEIFNWVVCYMVILFLSLKACSSMGESIYDRLARYGDSFVFQLTKGDRERQEDIREKDVKNAKKIIIDVILSLIFNVVCGIISSVLV